jgi:hypothetical protein
MNLEETKALATDVQAVLKEQALNNLVESVCSTSGKYKKIIAYTVVDNKTSTLAVTEKTVSKAFCLRRNTATRQLHNILTEAYRKEINSIPGLKDVTEEDLREYMLKRFRSIPVYSDSGFLRVGSSAQAPTTLEKEEQLNSKQKALEQHIDQFNKNIDLAKAAIAGISHYIAMQLSEGSHEKVSTKEFVDFLNKFYVEIRNLKVVAI